MNTNLDQTIIDACKADNLDLVKECLQNNSKLANEKFGPDKSVPLHFALQEGASDELLRELFQYPYSTEEHFQALFWILSSSKKERQPSMLQLLNEHLVNQEKILVIIDKLKRIYFSPNPLDELVSVFFLQAFIANEQKKLPAPLLDSLLKKMDDFAPQPQNTEEHPNTLETLLEETIKHVDGYKNPNIHLTAAYYYNLSAFLTNQDSLKPNTLYQVEHFLLNGINSLNFILGHPEESINKRVKKMLMDLYQGLAHLDSRLNRGLDETLDRYQLALSYYDSTDENPNTHLEAAKCHLFCAHLMIEEGQFNDLILDHYKKDGALTYYKSAFAIFEQIDEKKQTREIKHKIAQAHAERGKIHSQMGNQNAAEEDFLSAYHLTQSIIESDEPTEEILISAGQFALDYAKELAKEDPLYFEALECFNFALDAILKIEHFDHPKLTPLMFDLFISMGHSALAETENSVNKNNEDTPKTTFFTRYQNTIQMLLSLQKSQPQSRALDYAIMAGKMMTAFAHLNCSQLDEEKQKETYTNLHQTIEQLFTTHQDKDLNPHFAETLAFYLLICHLKFGRFYLQNQSVDDAQLQYRTFVTLLANHDVVLTQLCSSYYDDLILLKKNLPQFITMSLNNLMDETQERSFLNKLTTIINQQDQYSIITAHNFLNQKNKKSQSRALYLRLIRAWMDDKNNTFLKKLATENPHLSNMIEANLSVLYDTDETDLFNEPLNVVSALNKEMKITDLKLQSIYIGNNKMAAEEIEQAIDAYQDLHQLLEEEEEEPLSLTYLYLNQPHEAALLATNLTSLSQKEYSDENIHTLNNKIKQANILSLMHLGSQSMLNKNTDAAIDIYYRLNELLLADVDDIFLMELCLNKPEQANTLQNNLASLANVYLTKANKQQQSLVNLLNKINEIHTNLGIENPYLEKQKSHSHYSSPKSPSKNSDGGRSPLFFLNIQKKNEADSPDREPDNEKDNREKKLKPGFKK